MKRERKQAGNSMMNKPKSNGMRSLLKPQELYSLFMLILICTFAGSALLQLITVLEGMFSGRHFEASDFFLMLVVLIISCQILFIPVTLGVILLRWFLRYSLRKGWLTRTTGSLSGIGIWGLGGILFCLILADPSIGDPALKSPDFLTRIQLVFTDVLFLQGIAIAGLVGGWAGQVLSKQMLIDQTLHLLKRNLSENPELVEIASANDAEKAGAKIGERMSSTPYIFWPVNGPSMKWWQFVLMIIVSCPIILLVFDFVFWLVEIVKFTIGAIF